MQRDLWGCLAAREAEYWVFHDESEPNKRWFLVGLLLVKRQDLDEVRRHLRTKRESEGYRGEVHFADLPKSFGGAYGAKARVAREWISAYERYLSQMAFCSVLAVDRASNAYDRRRFAQDYHAYNRFTAMAIKAAVAWHLGPLKLDRVVLRIVSDAKDRKSQPDQGMVDNFDNYVPWRVETDAERAKQGGSNYPAVSVAHLDLQHSADDDLLQLLDILLGATQEALVGGATRPTKRKLGQRVVRWIEDLRKPPWEQNLGLHRKFNVWGFPDREGKAYSLPILALPVDDNQLSLF